MIVAATADRSCYGASVIRNTYQTEITRHDLNHQHRWSGLDTRLGSASAVRQARPAKRCRPLYAKKGQISMHVMPGMHKKPDFLDMTEIRV